MRREVECEVGLPFDPRVALAYWEARLVPGMERIEGDVYRRSLRHGSEVGELTVDFGASLSTGLVTASTSPGLQLKSAELEGLVLGLVDGGSPAADVAKALRMDPIIGPLASIRPGVRIPGTVDPFELTIRAIVGQQVSVRTAATFTARIAECWGERVSHLSLPLVFPEPARLVNAPIEDECGVSRQRADAIRSVARLVHAGELDLSPGKSTVDDLESIRGIGPWTASYVCLRGLLERDAIPVGDLGIRSALGLRTAAEVAVRAESWRPFRGYAAVYLWATYLELQG